MDSRQELERNVLMAARDTILASVFFRNAMGHRVGLNITDYEALSFLRIQGTASPSELARYTGLTAGSTTTMLDRLEKAGHILIKPNPKDGRSILVEINPDKEDESKALVVGIQKAHRELLASCTPEELAGALKFLTGFTKNVVEATDGIESSQ